MVAVTYAAGQKLAVIYLMAPLSMSAESAPPVFLGVLTASVDTNGRVREPEPCDGL